MKNLEPKLLKFLNSTEGWADENIREFTPKPGLKTSITRKGVWTYSDQYVGGEPFQGFEIVWLRRIPVWSMSYRGLWNGKDYKEMLRFAKKALRAHSWSAPWRGPKRFSTKDMPNWSYTNKWHGTIREFRGTEKIFFKRKEVGWTIYHGGVVNRKHLNL
jgi:hypothetical protein